MNNRRWTWALAFIVALGLALSGTRGAEASLRADKLPPIKNPSAAKFNMTGMVTISSGDLEDMSVPVTGSGKVSGDDYQLDITAESLGGSGSTEFTFTGTQILVDGKLYMRTSSSPGSEGEWYVIDAQGVLADNPIGGIGSIIGLNPRFEEFIQVEQMGKEAVEGVASTKYKLDIDFKGMSASIGTNLDTLGDVQYVMYLWIGDQDQYIHKVSYMLSIQSGDSEFQTEVAIEYDITFYDFNVPVSIVAPPDAEPINIGGMPVVAGGMPGSINDPSMGMPGMTSAGMPKSGVGTGSSSLPLAMLVLALGLLMSGVTIRRVAHSRQSI